MADRRQLAWTVNRIGFARVVDDDDYDQQIGWWVSGRVLGRYFSFTIPWRRKVTRG